MRKISRIADYLLSVMVLQLLVDAICDSVEDIVSIDAGKSIFMLRVLKLLGLVDYGDVVVHIL